MHFLQHLSLLKIKCSCSSIVEAERQAYFEPGVRGKINFDTGFKKIA